MNGSLGISVRSLGRGPQGQIASPGARGGGGNYQRRIWNMLMCLHAYVHASLCEPCLRACMWTWNTFKFHATCYLLTFNPNPGGYINWCCHVARSNIWPLRRPIGEREALRHATVIVGSSAPSLRQCYRQWGQLKNCLVCQLLTGGVPGQGVVEEGVKESNTPPYCSEYTKTEQRLFRALFGL
jgi:hypothetical protein